MWPYNNIHYLIVTEIFYSVTGNVPPLTMSITTGSDPDTEDVRNSTENNLFEQLSSGDNLKSLAQTLSKEFETSVQLENVRMGSIKVDMILGDMSRLEYIKELSDKYVLTNIVDSILITPEFIESCHAEDVTIEVILDEESYQQVKNFCSKYMLDCEHNVRLLYLLEIKFLNIK